MEHRRNNISAGIVLIVLGVVFLLFQIFPYLRVTFTWPMIILLVALGLLVIGLLTLTPEMVIPASIVGGIGSILYLQNSGILTWASWAYLWTLIPGFAGIGTLIAGLLRRQRKMIVEGLNTLLTSAILFAIFGAIFGNMFGFFPLNGVTLALLLIGLGVILFIRALLPSPHHGGER
ncbi:MAG TPA: hypothetical protein PKH77_20720 [Anaerolineae bacterium]|nr:hypothetical protein [Anaerolineae bacterium]